MFDEGSMLDYYDLSKSRGKKNKKKLQQEEVRVKQKIFDLTDITIPESISVKDLSAELKKTSGEIIKKLLGYGILATINNEVDFDTAFLIAEEFVERVEYNSYEDFKKNFKIKIPENFNFAFDVVDKYAEIDENKMALVWTNDEESHSFTFSELKKLSNQTANFFKSLGIKKEDKVILTLKNRYEFWISMVALHKIGAIAIPATHMLKRHDIHYRITNAEIKAVISVKEDVLLPNYESVEEELGI